MNNERKDLTLEALNEIEWLTVRSINICKDAGLNTLNLILEYYSKNGSFLSIRNCGAKTEKELIEICKKYKDSYFLDENIELNENEPIEKEEKIIDVIDSLNPFQKATLNRHLENLISNLNARSFNGLSGISKSLNPKEIFETIFSNKFNFKSIRNIGVKSVDELEFLKRELIRFVLVIQSIQKEELSKEYNKLVLNTTFSSLPESFEENFEELFEETGKIKLFKLLDILINSEQIFNETTLNIFRKIYSYDTLQTQTNKTIAKNLTISGERVRQIKSKLNKEIQNYFLFVPNLITNDLMIYGVNPEQSCIVIEETLVKKINQGEKVNFNKIFYASIFGILLKQSHSILGDKEINAGKNKTINQKNYTCSYIINSKIDECFNFEQFVLDIHLKLNDKISESYSLQFQGYIYNFFIKEEKIFFDEIFRICESIIYNEYDMILNTDGYITFERNTFKQLHEYCYEILNEFSKPMTIEEIENCLNTKYPFVRKTSDSIRGSLIREKNIFISFGRTSTYGLRKWENEQENVKGGTIRDIVEEILIKEDSIKHISEILDFVLQFRPETNENSILSNIKVDESNKFCFYEGDFIGLKAKVYTLGINPKRIVGSHFREIIFKKMIGWHIDKIVNYYIKQYGYEAVQIKFLIKKKTEKGELKFSHDNNLII